MSRDNLQLTQNWYKSIWILNVTSYFYWKDLIKKCSLKLHLLICLCWLFNPRLMGSLSPRHATSPGCRWRNHLKYRGQLQLYWKSSHGQLTRGVPPAWGLGEVLTNPHHYNWSNYIINTCASGLDWSFVRPKQWKRNKRFGTWNVRRLCRSSRY